MEAAKLKGLIYANLTSLIVLLITRWILSFSNELGTFFIWTDFILLPIIMGIINAFHIHKLQLKVADIFWWALFNTLVAILLNAFVVGEGYICLFIVSPLILVFIFVGIFIGIHLFRRNNKRLNVSVVGIVVILFISDWMGEHHYEAAVEDRIVIKARPEQIWKHVVSFEPIKTEPHYWLFRIGMPMPYATTVDSSCLGSGRKCIFSNGLVFDEKISEFEPNKKLTFDIIEQPADPEILGHIKMHKGQFLIEDNGDGTSTLVGTSWYTLFVFPAWYYDLWAQSITRNVHIRVMEHIKELSEHKLKQ